MIVDGYIRVSQVNDRAGERFISPTLQRDAIEGWARLHGAVVGELFEELDESGARTDRPLLERAIARLESGESGGIVVSRLDRFGRSLLDGLAGIDRITRAGGTFVAVEDGLDLSTDTGDLAWQSEHGDRPLRLSTLGGPSGGSASRRRAACNARGDRASPTRRHIADRTALRIRAATFHAQPAALALPCSSNPLSA